MVEYPAGQTCDVIAVRLESYVLGSLPRRDALGVAEHLEACVWCAERLLLFRVRAGVSQGRDEH